MMERHKAMPDQWAVDQKLLRVLCYMNNGMLEGGKLLAAGNNFMKCSRKWQLLRARILSRIPKEFGVHWNTKNIQFSLLTIIRILEKLFNFVHYIAYDLATGFQILSCRLSHKLTLNPGRCFLFKSLINGHFSRSVVSFLSSVATSGCGRKPRPQLPTWLVAQVRKGAAGQVMEAELFYQRHRKTESFYVKKKKSGVAGEVGEDLPGCFCGIAILKNKDLLSHYEKGKKHYHYPQSSFISLNSHTQFFFAVNLLTSLPEEELRTETLLK